MEKVPLCRIDFVANSNNNGLYGATIMWSIVILKICYSDYKREQVLRRLEEQGWGHAFSTAVTSLERLALC